MLIAHTIISIKIEKNAQLFRVKLSVVSSAVYVCCAEFILHAFLLLQKKTSKQTNYQKRRISAVHIS